MDIDFVMKKSGYLFGLALVLSILLLPERVAVRETAAYPQASAMSSLKPEVLALIPVPLRKPELNPNIPVHVTATSGQSVFKGLTTQFAAFFNDANTTEGKVKAIDFDLSEAVKYKSAKVRTPAQRQQIAQLKHAVSVKLKSAKPVDALKLFRESSARGYLDTVEHDMIQSSIAASFLYNGKIESAGKLAAQSADRSGQYVPMAGWVAGLSLWQQGKYDLAAINFEKTGRSRFASTWMASAGSFWASRAHERAGNRRAMMLSLQQASKQPRTFYGLMAVQALGQKFSFNWDAPVFDAERKAVLQGSSAGARALELVAAGQYLNAEAQLLRISDTQDPALRDALFAYAAHVGLPKLSLYLGNRFLKTNGQYHDAALYPVTPWEPKAGYSIDRALVHAVMRQESKFDATARSRSGAVGLMQIMPKTANYVARNKSYGKMLDLNSPQANVMIGQDYLEYLLADKNVDGDVLSLLVAYNAGPGNLAKWKAMQAGNDDPLLFIEMIPVKETREYVERVMTNYWMYRLRDGKDVPTLRAVSKGEPAKYASGAVYDGAYALAALGR
jgi:soluble lytic murein transglycosylase